MFFDLPQNATSAVQYYQELNDPQHEALQAFWAQFQDSSQTQLLPDKLKQIELLYLARPIMEATFLSLWPKEAVLASFFDLAARLQQVSPRIAEWKGSAVRAGAQQA